MAAFTSRGLPDFHNPRFRNEYARAGSLSPGLERRWVAVQKGLKAIGDFVDGLVFAAQGAQGHLGKISGDEKWRRRQLHRIFNEGTGLQVATGEFAKQHC